MPETVAKSQEKDRWTLRHAHDMSSVVEMKLAAVRLSGVLVPLICHTD